MGNLDDFNRRTTAGSGSWVQGPPTSAAESAAQSFIDQRSPGTTGGGGIDFGVRVSAVILLAGIGLFALGNYMADRFYESTAMTGLLIVIISGFVMLIGTGGVVVGCIRGLGSARGWLNLILAALAAAAAWWFSQWLWMMSFALVPDWLIPPAAAALMLVLTARR